MGGGGGGSPSSPAIPNEPAATPEDANLNKGWMQGPWQADGTYNEDQKGFGTQPPPSYPGMAPVGTTPNAPHWGGWMNQGNFPGQGQGYQPMWGQTWGGGFGQPQGSYNAGFGGPYQGGGTPWGTAGAGAPPQAGQQPYDPSQGGQMNPSQGGNWWNPGANPFSGPGGAGYWGGGNYVNPHYGAGAPNSGFFAGMDFSDMYQQQQDYLDTQDPYQQVQPPRQPPPKPKAAAPKPPADPNRGRTFWTHRTSGTGSGDRGAMWQQSRPVSEAKARAEYNRLKKGGFFNSPLGKLKGGMTFDDWAAQKYRTTKDGFNWMQGR